MKNIFFSLAFLAALAVSATPAPNFTVTTSDNQSLQLYSSFVQQGKVLVIEAFFTTCPPCNAHAPLMQNLYTQMQAEHPGKVEFLLLSTLSSDSNVKVAQYKTAKGLTMPAVGANGGSQVALQPYMSNQFGLFEGTPTFIVIAPNSGEVHFDIRGGSASETMTLLSQKINELLPPPTCALSDFFGGSLESVALSIQSAAFDTSFIVSGSYGLGGVQSLKNQSYTIRPSKDDNPLNGITTYDLVLISKHILGIEALSCDWQRLAADVDCSGTITTFDIVTARKLILGILQELPCGAYRFSPDSAVANQLSCAAFMGVKIGDVNSHTCVQVAPDPDDRSTQTFNVQDAYLEAGQTIQVRCRVEREQPAGGFQLQFGFDARKLRLDAVQCPALQHFDEENYSIMAGRKGRGRLAISWIDPLGQTLPANGDWMEISATALASGRLSDMLNLESNNKALAPEIYDAEGRVQPLRLEWQNTAAAGALQLHPNPVSDRLQLEMDLQEPATLRLELSDALGHVLQSFEIEGQLGRNYREINVEALPAGIYRIRVGDMPVKKFIRL